jgi:hypothetical protein
VSSEHLNPSESGLEKVSNDLESARSEKLAELHEQAAEKDPSDSGEKRAEQAREVINKQEKKPEPEPSGEAETARPSFPLLNRHLNYSQTLASVQRKLKPVSRGFSHVIHMPIVEKTSESLEKTVARPSVMVGTTWTALIVGTIFYLTARHYGYALSGSELLFSFIVGGLLGLVIEGLWRGFKRR